MVRVRTGDVVKLNGEYCYINDIDIKEREINLFFFREINEKDLIKEYKSYIKNEILEKKQKYVFVRRNVREDIFLTFKKFIQEIEKKNNYLIKNQ